MQEIITFDLTVTKKITEVLNFVTEKAIDDKMQSYCDYDEMKAEQFKNWIKEEYIDLDAKKGTINIYNDYDYMEHDNVYVLEDFVEDIANTIPDCEFSGCIYYADSLETSLKINFQKTKEKFEIEEKYLDDGDFDEEFDDEACDEGIEQEVYPTNQDVKDVFIMNIEDTFSMGSSQIVVGNIAEGSVSKDDIININGAEFVVKEITYKRKSTKTASAGMDVGLTLTSVTGKDYVEQGATIAHKS